MGLWAKEGSAADGHLTGDVATSIQGGGTLGETVKMYLSSPKAKRLLFYPLSTCSWNWD